MASFGGQGLGGHALVPGHLLAGRRDLSLNPNTWRSHQESSLTLLCAVDFFNTEKWEILEGDALPFSGGMQAGAEELSKH